MELGAKIRQLRKERGLSQEEVGRGVLTRSMISAIERGKARPSLRALEVIAQALGRPVDYFLEDDATDQTYKRVRAHLTVANSLLSQGEPGLARELLLSALPAADHLGYRALEIRIALGRAELRLGHAAAARREFESCLGPDDGVLPEELAEARFYLGEAYLVLGQPVEALSHLESALPGLRAVDEQLGCLMAMARASTVLGAPSQAVSRLETAMDLGYGQGVAEQARQRLREAQRQLTAGAYEAATREAELSARLFETNRFLRDTEQVPLLLGRTLARAGAEHRALSILRLAYRSALAHENPQRAAELLTEMATIHRSLGRLQTAKSQARHALNLAGSGNAAATAQAQYLLGVVCREEEDLEGARQHLTAAADAVQGQPIPDTLRIDVYTLLADVLRSLGDDRQAYEWLSRAHGLIGSAGNWPGTTPVLSESHAREA